MPVISAFDWAGFQSQSAINLIKNSPGEIAVDGAEPQWWDDVVNATITDEDAAGEGIADKAERVFKVVTSANDVYGYQTFTLADELLLDAGQTVVSLSCWVYCATAAKASVGIFGTNLTLQESIQAPATAWTLLTVENITLNAGDATIQVRLIVDTDTAWFTMPMLNVGPNALPWRFRGWRFVPQQQATQFDLNTTGDVAWSDTDCTANSDPLAVAMQALIFVYEQNGTTGSSVQLAHHDDVVGGDSAAMLVNANVIAKGMYQPGGPVFCNDSQVIRYKVEEQDADNDVIARCFITGYWMWE